MRPVLLALPRSRALGEQLARAAEFEVGDFAIRQFPDGEHYIRVETPLQGRAVVLACTLDRPDAAILPLLLLAATARDLGAERIVLVAPYLAYMRQDRRFNPGEGVTSAYFARLISGSVDALLTVDPHLHRRSSLEEIYSIPSTVVHAAAAVSAWIRENVDRPVLVGPDAESAQWVSAVAAAADAPFTVLEKVRRGDRDVEISIPDGAAWRAHTPVLVDDIISTARTMSQTVRHLRGQGFAPPICVGVHAIFAEGAVAELESSGAGRVVTCNTVAHPTNGIDIVPLLAAAVPRLLAERR
jgi:ribose-phosphate pyrophosphokinase